MQLELLIGKKVVGRGTKEIYTIKRVEKRALPQNRIEDYFIVEFPNEGEKMYNFKNFGDLFAFFDQREELEYELFSYYKSDDCIQLTKALDEDSFEKFFKTNKKKCWCTNEFAESNQCNRWYQYACEAANDYYYKRYHDDYCTVNELFIDKEIDMIIENNKTKYFFIVMCGCGNLYELECLSKIIKRHPDLFFNIVFLDQILWQKNSFKKEYICDNSNVYFKQCDIFKELFANIYKKADLIYISRALNVAENGGTDQLDELFKIIKKYSFITISQVLDHSNQDSVDFENNLRQRLNSYNVFDDHSFTTNCNSGYKLNSLNSVSLNCVKGFPLQYYLYEICREVN